MAAKIRRGDLIKVVCSRPSDERKLAERNTHRAAEGPEPLKPDDEDKQGRVIKVFPIEGTVLAKDVNLRTRYVCQSQDQTDGIGTVEAPISLARVVLVDPDIKQRMRVGFRGDAVEHDGRTRRIRVRVTRGSVARGIGQGKEV